MVIFFALNILVAMSAWMLTVRCKRGSLADSCIDWFCFYFGLIVISEIILGIFGILRLEYLAAVHIAIAIFIYALFYRKKPATISINKEAIKEIFQHKTAVLIASILFAFGCVKLSINLVNPPFGWDCLNYHFSFPVEWLKHANLNNPITVFCDPSPSYYPINGSLFFFWLMAPLKNVFMADLGQLPFFIISLAAVFSMARKLGLSREYAFYAAGLFGIIPNYFKQLEIAYVDIMVASLFFVCVHYLLLLCKNSSLKDSFMFSVAFGLFVGVKTLSLAYAILLFIPFCFIVGWRKRMVFSVLFLFIMGAVIFGGFSYIRNFIDTGNPLYPFDFQIVGKTIFKGVMDKATYSARFIQHDYSLNKLLFEEGLSGQGLVFIFLPAFLALPLMVIKRKKQLTFIQVYLLALPLLIYLIYRFIIPLANTRYLYPMLGIGMVVSFLFIDVARLPKAVVIALSAICALASMSELASRTELAWGILSSLSLFAVLVIVSKKHILAKINLEQARRINPQTVILASGIAAMVILSILNVYYVKNEFRRYILMEDYSGFWPDATRAWKWLNDHSGDGARIAYVGRPVPFPLYGERFKNDVFYVSVNEIDPAKLHYFPNSHYSWGADAVTMHESFERDGNYRSNADYATWLSNLRQRNTDYLFVYSLQHTKDVLFSLEDAWARGHPDIFKEVFANKTIHVYELIQ